MITQTQFASLKEDAIKNQPIRKEVSLSEIEIQTLDSIQYAGLNLGLTRPALKDLFRILGISQSTESRIETAVGEEGARAFLNQIRQMLSRNGGSIILLVTPDRMVQRITKGGANSPLFSTGTYFDVVDRFLNRDSGMAIDTFHFNRETGGISISAKSPKAEFQVGGLSDEVFHAGLNLSLTAEGIKADPYMHRLVCTNGMVTRQFEESFALHRNNGHDWQTFWSNLERIEAGGFTPRAFQNKVLQARETPASLHEVERSMNLILGSSNIDRDQLQQFINFKPTYNRLHSAGLDTEKLSDAQKRNVRTGLKVWDCINGITDYASHNYGFDKKANTDRHLQLQAGDILSKSFDTRNLILNQPF